MPDSSTLPVVRIPKWSMADPSVLAAALHLERERIVRIVVKDAGEELRTDPRLLVLPDAVLSDAANYRALVAVGEIGGTVIRAKSEVVGQYADIGYWRARGFSDEEIDRGMHPWKKAAREGAAKIVLDAEAQLEKAKAEADMIRRGTFVPA